MAPTSEFAFPETVSASGASDSNNAPPPPSTTSGTWKPPSLFDGKRSNLFDGLGTGRGDPLPDQPVVAAPGASSSDISILRDQIFENIKIAYPVLCKNQSDNVDFMIGVSRTKGFMKWQYQAYVMLGTNRVRVIEGTWGDNMLAAYENLFGATAEMLGRGEFRSVWGANVPTTTRVALSGSGAFYVVG